MLQDGLLGELLARLLHLLRCHLFGAHGGKLLGCHCAGEDILAQCRVLLVPEVEYTRAECGFVLVAGAFVEFVQALFNAFRQLLGVQCSCKIL